METATIERRFLLRLIVRRFQLRFLTANLLHVGLIALALLVTIFGPPAVQLLSPSIVSVERERAAAAFLALHAYVWIGVALALVVGLARIAVVSHRIAGPLVRLVRTLEAVRRGDVSMRFRVRAKDYLIEEAAALDAATTGLRRRLRVVKGRARRLDAALADLRAAHGQAADENLERRMLTVDVQMRRLRAHLDRFQTEPGGEPPAPSMASTPPRANHDTPKEPAATGSRQDGFTLVEALLVVVIISTVSALVVPMYEEALNRARVVRASADIRSMDVDIQRFLLVNGRLPNTLMEAGLDLLRDPYGMPYQYLPIAGTKGKGGVRKDHKLNPINSDFDLFSMGRNRVFKTQLTNIDSLDDIVRANNGGFIGLAADY